MNRKKVLYVVYLTCLILIVGMKFTGNFKELWMRAAVVRENREAGVMNANLEWLRTIRIYLRLRRNPIYFRNLVGNIIPFIPLGYFPASLQRRKRGIFRFAASALHALSIVLFIELFQLVTGFGYFDVDDILLNMIGFVIGYAGYLLLGLWSMHRRNGVKNKN